MSSELLGFLGIALFIMGVVIFIVWITFPFFVKRLLTNIEAQLIQQNQHLAKIEAWHAIENRGQSLQPQPNLYGLAPTPLAPPPPQ